MATKIFLRPHSLSFSIFSSTTSFFRKPTFLSLFSAAPQTLTQSQTLPYGPSLLKGQIPQISQSPSKIPIRFEEDNEQEDFKDLEEEKEENVLDKAKFTRVFDIVALRVPSNYCFSLESRLRGHLLNWPRVRNIARVDGDEVGADVVKLIGAGRKKNNNYEDNDENLNSLNRRIYGMAEGDGEKLGPVLYREKLVKEFNSRGFEKFRNLAKLSRPKKKKNKKKSEEEKVQNVKGEYGRNKFAMVEVVEEEEENGEDLRGLLGDEFKARRWRGSTRLLLLDERYADRGLDELPEAIKAVFREDTGGGRTLTFELVKCKLTLFYDYWQMNEILEALLPKDMIVPSAFEIVGHIAHLNLGFEHLLYKKVIAKVVLDKNKPKIQTVVNKIEAIHNDYRTMQLEVLAGNRSLVTTVVENGIRLHVDLAAVYWNSRLGTERQRLLNGFKCSDVVCDVFAGVGPIAISAAKIVKRVYANDLNPHAIEYLEKNSVLNKLEKKIEVFNMDGRRFISAIFAGEKVQSITQVVMNLPNDAAEYLDAFRGIFRNRHKDREFTLPMIHVYGFSKARDPEFDFHERIRIALSEVAVDVKMRKVRLVAPGKWMLCASFILPECVAFGRTM